MSSKKTSKYLFEDYIKDSDFRAWVFNPTNDSDIFWSHHIEENPDNSHNIEKAKLFLIGVQEYYNNNQIDDIQVSKKYEEFLTKYPTLVSKNKFLFKRNKKHLFRYSAAATILVLIGLTFFNLRH